MPKTDISQRQLDNLEIRLLALETYLRDREKGHKIKVVFGLIVFLATTSVGIYFYWFAR
jgi:hypothetical protein